MIRRSTLVCGAAMALALPLSNGIATADDGAERETWGACSGGSRWELSSETTRGGGIQVEFEVEGAPVASQWSYTLSGPSGDLASGTATADREGELEVRALTTGSMDDVFTAFASSGDQTCDSTLGAQTGDDDSDDHDGDHSTDEDSGDDGPGYRDDDHRDDSSSDHDDDDGYDDHSRNGNGTVMEGYCDGSSSLTVATSRRGRTIVTIDSNRGGQKWHYSLKQGRKTLKKGVGTTKRDGALVVKTRKTVKTPRATAARVDGDERCATSRVS